MNQGNRFRIILLLVSATIAFTGCDIHHELSATADLRLNQDYIRWNQAQPVAYRSSDALSGKTGVPAADQSLRLAGKLTLQDSVKLALIYNADLLAVVQEQAIADGQVLESYAAVLPSVTLQGGYRRISEAPTIDVGGTVVDLGSVDNYSVDLVVRQPIFHGQAIPAQLRAARLASIAADHLVRKQIQDTVFLVCSHYYSALLAQQLVASSRESVTSAQLNLDETRKRRERGLATEYAQLRAEVELANLQAEALEKDHALQMASANLLSDIGAAHDSDVTLADALEYRPFKMTLDQAVQSSFAKRSDLLAMQAHILSGEEQLRIDQSKYFPRVDGFFREGWQDPNPVILNSDHWGNRWETGILLEWSLFDGLAREGIARRNRAVLAQMELQKKAQERRLVLEIQESMLLLQNSDAIIAAQTLNVERAKSALKLVEEGVDHGVNTSLELSDSRTAVAKAKEYYFHAVHDYLIATLRLRLAMGILDDPK